jgi:hypothetical protein
MTIEIKQLVIRAVADGRREHAAQSVAPHTVAAPAPVPHEPSPLSAGADQEAIVAACVREVLRKLERSRER